MSFDCCDSCSNLLFTAAKEGDLDSVKRIISKLNPDDLETCLNSASKTGSTPLIIASRYGHVEIVEYLLSQRADPSACGTVSFDGEVIPKVPPLWAAAAAGHIRICEILVERKVNVNQTSSTNSTPLRGACYDGHLDIVKFLVKNGADIEIPNRHGHTALMISCYRGKLELVEYLLELGALVNRRSLKGNTALHDAAEIGSLPIIRKLLESGAQMLEDDYGVTPLLVAALHGQTDVLPVLFLYSSWRAQREAWKLLGATMVDRRNDLGFGVACWKTAYTSSSFVSKKSDCEDGEMLPDEDNFPLLDEVKLRVYGGYREAQNLQEVQDLVGDPEAIRMQALLVRERILGESHPETHHYLRYRGAIFCEVGRWDRAFDFWSYILQLEQFYLPPLSISTTSAFVAFADAFTVIVDGLVLQNDRAFYANDNNVTLEQVIVIMERAIYEAERYLRCDEEPETDPFEEFDIRQETENLLNLILHFLHLANRVYFLSTRYDRRTRTFLTSPRPRTAAVSGSSFPPPSSQIITGNLTQSAATITTSSNMAGTRHSVSVDIPLDLWSLNDLSVDLPTTSSESMNSTSTPLATSSPFIASARSPNLSNASPTFSSSGGSSSSVSSTSSTSAVVESTPTGPLITRAATRFDRHGYHQFGGIRPAYMQQQQQSSQPYVFHSFNQKEPFCPNAFLVPLTEEMEKEPKSSFPLLPKCPHLRCLVRRIVVLFELLKVNPLHMACEEQDQFEGRRCPSRFVVEKLLEAGADPRKIDEYDNSALHVLLANSTPSASIVKLLLDAGVPLLARNVFNETCLDLIKKNAPDLVVRLRIGRYLSLKQLAANTVMRNLSGNTSFEGILPRELEKYIAIF